MNAHNAAWPSGACAPHSPRTPARFAAPMWFALGVVLACLGLLAAFHHIVADHVQQSQLRHAAFSAHADATWRCNLLRGSSQRDSCRAGLQVTEGVQRALQGQNAVPTAALAQTRF